MVVLAQHGFEPAQHEVDLHPPRRHGYPLLTPACLTLLRRDQSLQTHTN